VPSELSPEINKSVFEQPNEYVFGAEIVAVGDGFGYINCTIGFKFTIFKLHSVPFACKIYGLTEIYS
jgi:hypothetical protein